MIGTILATCLLCASPAPQARPVAYEQMAERTEIIEPHPHPPRRVIVVRHPPPHRHWHHRHAW